MWPEATPYYRFVTCVKHFSFMGILIGEMLLNHFEQ